MAIDLNGGHLVTNGSTRVDIIEADYRTGSRRKSVANTVYFTNEGELDIRAACIMGVHVKEGDNPIGEFGTGLKFAIATLLRTGHSIVIWSGSTRYDFDVSKTDIRGKEFEIVTMNGKELGFTTDTGKNWEVWMAYRELRCNAMDEPMWAVTDNYQTLTDSNIFPEDEGRTWIEVSGEAIVRAHKQRSLYFCGDRLVLHELPGVGQVLAGGSDVVFYRGVAAMKLQEPSIFTYNIYEKCTLTEDRTLSNGWWIPYILGRLVSSCESDEMILRAIKAPEKTFEKTFNYSHGTPTKQFLDQVGANRRDMNTNQSAVSKWILDAPFTERHEIVTNLTEDEKSTLEKAIVICQQADESFDITVDSINVCTSLGEGVMGLYMERKIYIARNVISTLGLNQTAGTILEEWVHMKHGFADNSRSLVSYFQDQLIRHVMKNMS
jgi:hypothetical protein